MNAEMQTAESWGTNVKKLTNIWQKKMMTSIKL